MVFTRRDAPQPSKGVKMNTQRPISRHWQVQRPAPVTPNPTETVTENHQADPLLHLSRLAHDLRAEHPGAHSPLLDTLVKCLELKWRRRLKVA
jgi:hypothetical protein